MKRKLFFFILFLISLGFFIEQAENYKIQSENEYQIETFFKSEPDQALKSTLNSNEELYLGVLEIPKISLKRGFYSYESPLNTVEKNIQVISSHCFPFQVCSFILASHSGSSSISFFKHLDQLQVGDSAFLYYKNKRIEYQLASILHQEKTGMISIAKPEAPQLVLTTCNKENDFVQDLYLFYEKK